MSFVDKLRLRCGLVHNKWIIVDFFTLCICVFVCLWIIVLVYLCIFTGIETGAGAQQVADNLTFMLPSLTLSPHQM